MLVYATPPEPDPKSDTETADSLKAQQTVTEARTTPDRPQDLADAADNGTESH